ncbi:tetratricopeptide repeat protein [Hyphomicrobium sp.]|jgi:tetratricopeptide (TPR) repeat protein|uniref:tetratricopeptide repeat protein n=1 Tax=Hyphomicrobium sp. TaxID=82 RepID=UPI002D07F136|nr:tetratricopeptide repeat protein [Hyphomicrobium sp.]HVZ03396.1 tetratricopeptide repeat protein [Hyphomicrobium sp.]
MRFCTRIIVAVLALAAGTLPALADDELLKTQPFPEQPAPAPAPTPKRAPSPPPAPPPNTVQHGEPGMMGLPWPKTPEEATKTLNNLYAFLATTDDHRQAGEIGAAIERLWRLSGGDTVNLLIDRAELFSSKNENDKALPLLDAAVDLAPDYAEAWSHRGYVEYRLNNYPAALGDLRRALALDPNHFRALDGMAKILTLMGEKKAALEIYDQLLKVHPNIEGAKTARDKLKKEVEGQGI